MPINQATTWTWTPDAGQPGGSEVWQGSGSGNGATAISAPGGPYDWQSGGQYYDNGGGPNPRRWRIKKVGDVWKAEKWEIQGGNWVQVSEGTLSHSAPLE